MNFLSCLFSDKQKSTSRSKRDGTPEKPVSPTQSQLLEEEVIPPSKQVLDGEDIQALAIQPQELAKVGPIAEELFFCTL